MKKIIKISLAALIILTISSCASSKISPNKLKEAENFTLPATPKNNEAVVYVVRPSIFGTAVRFNVFLDNKEKSSEMGYNRGNQYIYFTVKPGKHTIFSKAENWAQINFEIQPKTNIFIKQTAGLGFIMARNSLTLIEENEGKYHVKNSSSGTIKKTSE